MTDEIDEAIAQGILSLGNGYEVSRYPSPEEDTLYVEIALLKIADLGNAIRTALRERGYEIVPRDPTEAMLRAFGASDIRCNCEECATIAWAAMVSASPDRDEMK